MNIDTLSGEEIAAINRFSYEITKLTPGYPPVYLATITTGGAQASFVCPAGCGRAHFHSPYPGHVVAHCDRAQELHPAGYVLMLVHEIPRPPRARPTGNVFPHYPRLVPA